MYELIIYKGDNIVGSYSYPSFPFLLKKLTLFFPEKEIKEALDVEEMEREVEKMGSDEWVINPEYNIGIYKRNLHCA